MVNQKDRIVKILPAFLIRLIDAVCRLTQMYNAELSNTRHGTILP